MVDSYNNRLSGYDKDGKRKWIVETGAPGNQVNVTGADAVAASTHHHGARQTPASC